MEHISLEKEEDMIKLEQFFQAKKELNYTAIKDIRIHFKLEEVTKQFLNKNRPYLYDIKINPKNNNIK